MRDLNEPTDDEICSAAMERLGCAEASIFEYEADRGERRHWFALSVRYPEQKHVWMFVGRRHTRRQLLTLARKAKRDESVVSMFPGATVKIKS